MGLLSSRHPPLRYAVVGIGHIAQNAVLPAFANAKKRCRLTALISDDPVKRVKVARQYEVEHVFDYREYDEACRSGVFDAVYIALPNSMHAEFTCRAAQAGIHVLCEKPMAVTSEECTEMIRCCREHDVRLMIAYRLHFEKANLGAVELVQRGKLGEPRIFNSVFSMQVRDENIRVQADMGGGPLYDIGIYCINAARYLFRAEPLDVIASAVQKNEPRFAEVPEAVSAVLRFPGERIAAFTCSFGAADVSQYQVVGAKGDLRLDPAYEYRGELVQHITLKGRTRKKTFSRGDQFAPELIYFADCVRERRDPEPGGAEGLKDVRIIEALRESMMTGTRVALEELPADRPPRKQQQMKKRPARRKELVHAQSPHPE